jgi:hypothetical protein
LSRAASSICGRTWYMQQLIKYPPQFKIEFMSNKPPIYG